MASVTFAHVIFGAVQLVRMVRNVAVLFFADHFVGCNITRGKMYSEFLRK
jgi:hypothetical protein